MSEAATPRSPLSKALPSILAALFLAAILLLYMCSFITRFCEAAILTTFEAADASSVRSEPGLHLKWFWPVQSVYVYDQRWRFLEYLLADQTITADRKNVVVSISAVWKVADPLVFFKRFKTIENGEKRVKDVVRPAPTTWWGDTTFPIS